MSVSSVTATQPEPKSNDENNLTHPALRLPVHSDNDLSFSSLSDPPPPWHMDVYLSDYGFLFPPLIFGEATEHLYTDKQYPNNSCKNSCSWSASKPAGDIRTCTGTYTHTCMCRHICAVYLVLTDGVGVWAPLETSWSWERCAVSPWLLTVISCFVFVSLTEPDKDHCSID